MVGAVDGSLMSMLIVSRVGFGEPHQFGTLVKVIDCFGTHAVSLYAPVPMRLAGVCHQFTGSTPGALMTFSSTIAPTVPSRVHAVRHHPQALLSLTCTVSPLGPSGAVSPFISNAGLLAASCFSMLAWKLVGVPDVGGAPAAVWTAEKPWIAPRIDA